MIHPQADAMVAKENIQPNVPFWNFSRKMMAFSGTFHFGETHVAPEIGMLGDSHAHVLEYGLDTVLHQHHLAGLGIIEWGTDITDMSSKISQKALDALRNHPSISKVILTQRWLLYRNSRQWERLMEFAQCITEMGKALYILTDIPQIIDLPIGEEMMPRMAILTPRRMETGCGWDGYYSQEFYIQQQGEINRQLQAVCEQTGAVLVPLHLAFKQEDGRYKAFEIRDGRYVALYKDGNHLSWEGSLKAGQFIAPYIFPWKKQ